MFVFFYYKGSNLFLLYATAEKVQSFIMERVKQNTKEIANQYIDLVECKLMKYENQVLKPRIEVNVMMKAVESISTNESGMLLQQIFHNKSLVDILRGEDEQNACEAFVGIVDNVLKSNLSWGRIVAVHAFCFHFIELLIKSNKLERIQSVRFWLEFCLLKHVDWIKCQGEGEGWNDFLTSAQCKCKVRDGEKFLLLGISIFLTVAMILFVW